MTLIFIANYLVSSTSSESLNFLHIALNTSFRVSLGHWVLFFFSSLLVVCFNLFHRCQTLCFNKLLVSFQEAIGFVCFLIGSAWISGANKSPVNNGDSVREAAAGKSLGISGG